MANVNLQLTLGLGWSWRSWVNWTRLEHAHEWEAFRSMGLPLAWEQGQGRVISSSWGLAGDTSRTLPALYSMSLPPMCGVAGIVSCWSRCRETVAPFQLSSPDSGLTRRKARPRQAWASAGRGPPQAESSRRECGRGPVRAAATGPLRLPGNLGRFLPKSQASGPGLGF